MTAATAPLSRGPQRWSPGRRRQYTELLRLREFEKSLTDDRYLRACGGRIKRGDVCDADEILETTLYCDRAWLCPVCGCHAARHQFRQLDKTVMAWTSQGGSVALLTLTQGHSTDDDLDALWNRLGCGWGALVRGSGWRADQQTFGLRGYIRVTEVVHHPDTGWNAHLHVPLLVDAALDGPQLCELKDRLTARFLRGIRAAGGRATTDGQDLFLMRPHSERQIASYCSKATTARWNIDSRSPMAILSDLKETGEGVDLWKEFSATVTGTKRRRYSPSQGIDKLVPNRP